MKKLFKSFITLFVRLRYPVSLPEEVAAALGMERRRRFCSFKGFLEELEGCEPKNLYRLMARESAEAVFHAAVRKERFNGTSLFSFYLGETWVEFRLLFDEESCLRRIYLCHCHTSDEEGVEISLLDKMEYDRHLLAVH
mgnify:CR=1 FL=1|jgi:hypothetical protein